MSGLPKLTRFNDNVLSKYQIYNSIFMTLPFDTINNTGVLLPLFHKVCEKGFKKEKILQKLLKLFLINIKKILQKKKKQIYFFVLFNI